ncbi:hypothetical protein Q3G72_016173 [Acer saccharum]|nr:hypothetical protein Q3G72_016173 [Acer saccharum]
MFRCLFQSTIKRTLSTVTASPITTHNAVEIPLEASIHHHKIAASCHSSFDLLEHLISTYRDSRCLKDAKLFHLRTLKLGFHYDTFLCDTLVNIYVRAGDLLSANKLFDEMPDRNSVSWAALISGYTQNGMFSEACGMFREMVCSGFFPNHYAIGSVLRACQEFGPSGLKLGMQIHGLILKSKYAFDVLACNVVISMYGRCSAYSDCARRVFEDMESKNLISWNSIISVYSQRGDAVSAFQLLSSMQREGSGYSFRPNEYTFGSLITAACSCVDLGLCLLEQLLTRVKKSGLVSDLYVGSSLVNGFARFGCFDYARKIFEQMSQRNVVSMNGLMVGLVRKKHGEEATEVFVEMRNMVELNVDSYVILLSAFAEFASLEKGRRIGKEVHGYVIRSGLIDKKVAVGNGLINMYAKCGAIDDSRLVFRLMVEKDSVSWNTIISGLDQNEYFEDATKSFCEMQRAGIVPSNYTLISTLSSCASLGWIMLGQQVHGEAFKLGLDLDVSVSNALLALYADTGCLAQCLKVFSLMPENDQVSWNTVIGALSVSDSTISEAVKYYLNMMGVGWSPNRVTFINILAAVSSLSLGKVSQQIHAQVIKYHIAGDTTIENALLACYGKCGEMDECEKIFSRMSDRKDDVSWNSMISGYIHNELLLKAMDLVWFMIQRGQRLDHFTFATVLSACASVATLERGMEVHASALRACLESDVVVGSALVDIGILQHWCHQRPYANWSIEREKAWSWVILPLHYNEVLVVFVQRNPRVLNLALERSHLCIRE